MEHLYTLPRLFVKGPLASGDIVTLSEPQTHYLKNVLRRGPGDLVRVFDGACGEYTARLEILDKKSAILRTKTLVRSQAKPTASVSLIFPPLKKEALDILIEKATELGASDFYPVLTAQSDVRALNPDRIFAQMIEAAEQCERLTVPTLHELISLDGLLSNWSPKLPILAAIERDPDGAAIGGVLSSCDQTSGIAILIGPAGGWREDEKQSLKKMSFIHPVHLGDNILRAETAALAMLAALQFLKER